MPSLFLPLGGNTLPAPTSALLSRKEELWGSRSSLERSIRLVPTPNVADYLMRLPFPPDGDLEQWDDISSSPGQ